MSATLTPVRPSTPSQPDSLENGEKLARQQAIKQILRRRRFYIDVGVSVVIMLFLAVIWAVAEYNNAGGWPANGFSQSSGIHDVWNMWITYPFMGWVLYVTIRTWAYFGHTSISEREIQREMARQVGK